MSENEAVGSVSAVLTMESSSYSAGMRKLLAENARLRKSLKELGEAVDAVPKSGAKILSISANMQALGNASEDAAGKAMKLQNNIGLIDNVIRGQATKAIADLMRKLSGVGVVMDALPILGAVAGLVLVARVAAEAAEKFSQLRKAQESINTAYRPMLDKLRESNDTMARSNELIGERIQKLEGHPVNNLAVALYDARVEADKLGDSLFADLQRVQKLFAAKGNHVGILGAELTGEKSTNDVQGSIVSYLKQMDEIGQKIVIDTHNGSPADAIAADKKALADKRKSYMRYLYTQLAIADPTSLTYAPSDMIDYNKFYAATLYPTRQDSGAVASILRNELAYQSMAAETPGLKTAHDALQRELGTLQHARSVKPRDLSRFYARKIREYNAYQNDLFEHTQTTAELGSRMVFRNASDLARQNEKISRASAVYGSAQFDRRIASARGNADLALAQAREDRQSGALSAHGLAVRQIQIQSQLFSEQLKGLTEKLAQARADVPANTSENRAAYYAAQAKVVRLQSEIDTLKIQNHIRTMEAQSAALTTTPRGAATQAIDQYFGRFDAAGIARNATGGTLDSVNAHMARLMATGHGNFAGMFRGLAGMGATSALGGIENKFLKGPLEKMFGMGRPKGNAGDPLYVVMARAGAGAALMNPQLSSLTNLLGGKRSSGTLETSLASVASLIPGGGLFSKIFSFLPHFASGGAISSGLPSIVGENGPELFLPRGSGSIVPNDKLGGFGSGETHIHIDARGATDPAATAVAVHRAIEAMGKASVHHAVRAIHETKARTARG